MKCWCFYFRICGREAEQGCVQCWIHYNYGTTQWPAVLLDRAASEAREQAIQDFCSKQA